MSSLTIMRATKATRSENAGIHESVRFIGAASLSGRGYSYNNGKPKHSKTTTCDTPTKPKLGRATICHHTLNDTRTTMISRNLAGRRCVQFHSQPTNQRHTMDDTLHECEHKRRYTTLGSGHFGFTNQSCIGESPPLLPWICWVLIGIQYVV
jgi:hypothetical protein